MIRFFLFGLVLVTIGIVLHETRPGLRDFRAELDDRFLSVKADPAVLDRVVGRHPLDQLVTTLTPWEAVAQTRVEDYRLFLVFTTRYQTPTGPRQVKTLGLAGSFFTLPDRAALVAESRKATGTGGRARSARW